MKIVFIGSVEFSKKALEKLILLDADIVGVITKSESNFNSDFADLTGICRQNNIAYKCVTDINFAENIDWVRSKKPDIIFCFGFSHILKKEFLCAAPMGVIGFHPAALPQNRGRHPIIWALALGLKKTASTFFFMDEGTDSGDILSQVGIDIAYEDDAGSLYEKVTKTALMQIEEFLPHFCNGQFNRVPQEHTKSNCWRKRDKADGWIDFRMSSGAIYNLVRALTKPYVGAHVIYNDREIKVWKVREVDVDSSNTEYGKILSTDNGQVLVKCSDKAVSLIEHEFDVLPRAGEYFL
ncbi:MAG: formyltransferase family protein [Planctomycetota bacterium]|jgi:methionyl-tRNA formyltransferase